uniref:Uncharacterized protein n=1 Tax=Sphaerodactylus townsendi TaxID=933632 RepID=A0ACB8FTB7_9SAUR
MAGVELCEPIQLYNILNQATKSSRLAERNYLCLIDARTKREYDESHLITAIRMKRDPSGSYIVPPSANLDYVRHCVVYDGTTEILSSDYVEDVAADEEINARSGSAMRCARVVQEYTRFPVRVLKGGYERFTISYHFLQTQKIFWMPRELEDFLPYPVEIVPVPDSPEADMLTFFGDVCHFIERHTQQDAVLVFSTLGISRCCTAVMAYLMHSCKLYLKNAWRYVQNCKNDIRPNRGFVRQLSEWEARLYLSSVTNISEPSY